MFKTPQAAETYDERTDAITDLLKKLAADLDRHGREFAQAGSRDWGYPGDLGHVEELLRQAHNFLANIDED